jgi:hypothetical protein
MIDGNQGTRAKYFMDIRVAKLLNLPEEGDNLGQCCAVLNKSVAKKQK